MMTKTLNDVAEIRTGYPFRGAVDRIPAGGCLLVQAGNIDGQGDLTGAITRITPPANWHEHLLLAGDVVMVARGPRNDAATFTWKEEAVAASHLIILKTRKNIIISDFLTWFLNLPATQSNIRAMRLASTVPFVPVEAIGRLPVPVPALNVQEKIAAVQKLTTKEQRLMQELQIKKRVHVDGMLMKAVQQGCSEEKLIQEAKTIFKL